MNLASPLQAKIFLLDQIFPNIFWADVIDILLIAIFVYFALMLFKQSKSSSVFFGVVIMGFIYLLAKAFNLELTLAIFRIFFSVIIIGLIIIFQKELRQFFEIIVSEIISLWGSSWQKIRHIKTTSEHIENIVHVAERSAQQKIGMLVVIKGKTALDYYLQGGFDLNGTISEPLLHSIFDPSTPGHDGAVIIENDTITKFAVHLPLSEDFQQIKQYGTRHSAALGIAEKTDALSIIVSEERGAISVARDGKLKSIQEIGQLEMEIIKFLEDKFNPKINKNFLETNLSEKFLALVIALLLWYLIVYQLR
ncbi:MAG: diadenylate cyclase [Patescibacteria group bacterium]